MTRRAPTPKERVRKAEQRLIRVAWTLGRVFALTNNDYKGNNGLIAKLVRAVLVYDAARRLRGKKGRKP